MAGVSTYLEVPPALDGSTPNNSTSLAYEASRIIKSGPGLLLGLSGYNSKASGQFVLLFDATSVPIDGTVAQVVVTVPTVSNFSIDFGMYGRAFKRGIVVCNSSTAPTKTIGSADVFFDAQFV